MPERHEPDRLDAVLTSVGRHLVVDPAAADPGDPVGRVDEGDWRRRLLVAAAVVLVATVAVASIAPARRVVSGWLRAGNIDVEVDPDLTVSSGLPEFVDGVDPLDPDELVARLGQEVPDVTGSSLGRPDRWWAPPEGGILATWHGDSTSLWIVPTTETPSGMLYKLVHEPEAATSLPDLADGGYALEGRHIFQTPFRIVAADSVVGWSDGDLTFRLDSTLPADELIEIARSVAGG